MVEYVGIPYVEIIKHAFLPATISYIALLYIVHLEALKLGMQPIGDHQPKPWLRRLTGFAFGAALISGLSMAVYYGLGWLKPALGDYALPGIALLLAATYLGLLKIAASNEPLAAEDPDKPLTELPNTRTVLLSGLHFLLPVVVLVWCLMVERLSPGLSAFWGTVMLVIILLTQPLLNWLRSDGRHDYGPAGRLDRSARGAGGRRPQHDRHRHRHRYGGDHRRCRLPDRGGPGAGGSGGDALHGQPAADVAADRPAESDPRHGAAHHRQLHSGLQPAGAGGGDARAAERTDRAAHRGASVRVLLRHHGRRDAAGGARLVRGGTVSKGDPIKTGITAFYYSLRTAALPFLFIFNTDLLLIDVDFAHGVLIFMVATVAMLIFAAATQGHFLVKSRWYESVLLLLVAFTLFRPGFWMDMVHDPYRETPPAQLAQTLGEVEAESTCGCGSRVRMRWASCVSRPCCWRCRQGRTGKPASPAWGSRSMSRMARP